MSDAGTVVSALSCNCLSVINCALMQR